MTPPSTIRANFIHYISMLSDVAAQRRYEKDVPWVPTYRELVNTFFPDYAPDMPAFVAAFSEQESRILAEIEALLDKAREQSEATVVDSVHALQELPSWKLVIERAKSARALFQIPVEPEVK